jgi:endonuclease G, mitochondrial
MLICRRLPFALMLVALIVFCATLVQPTRAQTTSLHLTLGNPTNATSDTSQETNYLIERPQYALAYIRADGIPRWVAWRLVASDIGPAPRCNCFSADQSLPAGWNRVVTGDYTNSGYDRGHMTASEDRTATDADNEATFLMTNVIPQSPQNNRGPWARLEDTGRTIAQAGNEVYIVSGPVGTLGTLAAGTLRIPAATWKGMLVLPDGQDDPARVTTATRVIAIRISNDKADTSVQQSDPWETYRTTIDALEAEAGVDLFSAVPAAIQRVIEARQDTGPISRTLTLITGSDQAAGLGAAFAQELTVEVRNSATSLAEPNIAVVFASLGGSADARFPNSDTQITVLTDANGRARVSAAANAIPGTYRVEASIDGVYTPVIFMLTNTNYGVALPVVTGT